MTRDDVSVDRKAVEDRTLRPPRPLTHDLITNMSVRLQSRQSRTTNRINRVARALE
jgi:bifunctional DNase/RNase